MRKQIEFYKTVGAVVVFEDVAVIGRKPQIAAGSFNNGSGGKIPVARVFLQLFRGRVITAYIVLRNEPDRSVIFAMNIMYIPQGIDHGQQLLAVFMKLEKAFFRTYPQPLHIIAGNGTDQVSRQIIAVGVIDVE